MSRSEDVSAPQIVETSGETGREGIRSSSQPIAEMSAGGEPISAPHCEVERENSESADRRNGWIDVIGRSKLRKRLLHDIVPADSEENAIKLFRKIQRRIQENQRGSGVIVAAGHLDGFHSHVHVVHDCNWNSTTCKDVFLQGIQVKKRNSRYNRWSEELLRTFWTLSLWTREKVKI